MRILVVHNTLNDSHSVSGVLRHYAWMANEWTAAGHPTDFLVAKAGWPQLKKLAPRSDLISSDNLFDATRYLSRTWAYLPAYGLRMAGAHWLRVPVRYDVIYASSQLIFEVYPAMVLARRQRTRWAVKFHHVLASQPGRTGLFDRLFQWSERQSLRWINRRAGLVICSTAIVANDLHALEARLGLPPKHTVQIGYGVDLSASHPPSQSPQFDAVFLGRLHEHKGVFDLALVWQLVLQEKPGARLLVIGEGPQRQRIEDAFREMGIHSSVTFTGGIGEEEKNARLAQCRVGMSLSFEEGWGLSITEFLAAGLPVVAYELPVFGLVFPGQLDLVKAGDKQRLARQILALLNDEARRRSRGQQGRKFIERYDYRQVARNELASLEELAAQPH
ncbi:MAG: glycosyltransferase family 4 protein [Candidatus Omnitrophica bacterium]|nr:glycosyltransferase family 4 protein [Candidatus Omnitrophota bacterium]